jgi:hypothetical protein
MRLGQVHVERREWDAARHYFGQVYEHCRGLQKSVEADEKQLSDAMPPRDPASADAEFRLKAKELEALQRGLRVDYRLLLGWLITAGEQLQRVQEQQGTHMLGVARLWPRRLAHEVAGELHAIQSQSIDPNVKQSLERLERKLRSWHGEQISAVNLRPTDLQQVLKRADEELATLRQDGNYRVSELAMADMPKVSFDDRLIPLIVVTVADNVQQVARREGVTAVEVTFALAVRDDIVWLQIDDNAGEPEGLLAAVDALNRDAAVPSRQRRDGTGAGLAIASDYLREWMRMNCPWEVEVVSEQARKRLHIPLAFQPRSR